MKKIHLKKLMSVILILSLTSLMICGCSSGKAEEEPALKVGLVIDGQQIAEDPFQYSVWEGLEHMKDKDSKIAIKYLESGTEEEYLPNFDQLADEGHELIIGAGFLLKDAIRTAAGLNREVGYVLMDYTFDDDELKDNLTGVDFAAEISAFLSGYIAGNVTETDKVGFVGGIRSEPVERFEYGYRYGVEYASKELEKKIDVEITYTDTFWERLAGKNAAIELYDKECDVVLQAAGECGLGVIEAARLKDMWVIGADVDQYEEAPENILTSALKKTDKAAEEITEEFAGGGSTGGRNYLYGLAEGAVGIPDDNPNLEKYYPGLYERAMELQKEIKSGNITVPADRKSFDELSGRL